MGEGTPENLKKVLTELLALEGIELEDEEMDEGESKAMRSGDYSEMIQKTEEMLDSLNERAESIYEKSGMSKEELEAYGMNPDNFTPEQWEALQKVKAEADAMKNRAQAQLGEKAMHQTIEKERKKGRSRFGKKKRWTSV